MFSLQTSEIIRNLGTQWRIVMTLYRIQGYIGDRTSPVMSGHAGRTEAIWQKIHVMGLSAGLYRARRGLMT